MKRLEEREVILVSGGISLWTPSLLFVAGGAIVGCTAGLIYGIKQIPDDAFPLYQCGINGALAGTGMNLMVVGSIALVDAYLNWPF